MDKPAIEGQITTDAPAVAAARTYAWWLVLGLVGLDCFSTLGYLPTIAVNGAGDWAPLAAIAVSLLILFAALPVYLYVIGRSPHGRGATGLLESHTSGWIGKILVLLLLGFVATDFVVTRTLSVADASKHLLENPYLQSGVEWLNERKETVHRALPEDLRSDAVDRVFGWWDDQLIVTVVLIVVGFALYFYLLRGFTRGFLWTAAAIVALFLLVNGLVIGSGLLYMTRNPQFVNNWADLFRFDKLSGPEAPQQDALDVALILGMFAVQYLPHLVLGLSGFELTMTSAPLVRGRPDDDPVHPRGRIRNVRKLLIATAVLMAVFVPASVMTVTFLVPSNKMGAGGVARHRALAYLAHGGVLNRSVRLSTDTPVDKTVAAPDEPDEDVPAPKNPDQALAKPEATDASPAPTAADLNPLFGLAFGTLYDVSAVLILCLAGASVTISLRNLLPEYLTRYGMEMHWAQRIGALLHLFNVLVLVVVIAFRASVSEQQGAYATSVLVLLTAAALAAVIDLRKRWHRSPFRPLISVPFILVGLLFLGLAFQVCRAKPSGAVIALLFVAVLFVAAGLSRWMRSTELRYFGFTFADEESGVRWEQIRRLDFQVLVPHRSDRQTLAEKDAEIRARHRIGADVPVIFIEAELGDPSDFQQHPLMQIVKQDGMEVIRVSQCASIAHVLAAIALEFREVGRPPEIHFAWSEESPLASNLSFLLWGQGNIPWLVHALIRTAEPDPTRQPRVVIG